MKKNLPSVEPVELHEILSMRPGKFIFIALILLILLLAFLLFFLPGIVKGGRYTSFNCELSGVGVLLDGTYLGSADGSRYFIKSGEHEFTYVKDSAVIGKETIKTDKPIFFTLFAHRKADIDVNYPKDREIFDRAYLTALDEIVVFSSVTEYDEFYNYKPIFKSLAKDAVALNILDVSRQFETLASFLTSKEMMADLNDAIAILEASNVYLHSTGFDNIYNFGKQVLEGNTSLKASSNTASLPLKDGDFYTYGESLFTIGNDTTLDIPGVYNAPLALTVPSFSVSGKMVTEYEYALFVSENPSWAKSNKDTLVKRGLVDEYYLEGIYLSTSTVSTRPITNISFYAADAYCAWKSEKEGVTYRLMREAEFEVMASSYSKPYAKSLTLVDSDDSTPSALMGGLWELTSTHFVPLSRLGDYETLTTLESADIVLKGGSYINSPSSVSPSSVGVVAKNVTSPYMGFRLVREKYGKQ